MGKAVICCATTLCEKANIRKLLIKKFDEIASCKLVDFSGKQSLKVQQCFDHECTCHTGHRRYPEVVEDQEQRNLHHRVYYSHSCKKKLAACLHCPQEWSAEDLIYCYLEREQGVSLSHFPENDMQKLKSIILHHQIHGQAGEQEPAIVNAAYNHHILLKLLRQRISKVY